MSGMPGAWLAKFPRKSLQFSAAPAARRCMSKMGPGTNRRSKADVAAAMEEEDEKRLEEVSPSWAPHPRTGIYFPAGHERVMDDVPSGAASLNQTYWLRSVDGVDKPDPDVDYYQTYGARRHY
ncbi:PREDICTED: uncharacterized protein LOC109161304 isoform X2 [Ipomoea nil]|uniref:uncharacterized protein LOC109161304 isoform X2 n=1 Tax=Ipomoea nil TaxID=35883 RepID=UPI0009019C51|nr:PREDICTED: uncharacterized protein LOC109161304 isoform X2 [Ipomoea nil]